MELSVLNFQSGNKVSGVQLADDVFGRDYNPALIHQVIVAFQADARAGTKAQKTRSEVRGGGKKPWKQKGMGRARAGTIRSPLWRKGGVVFAAKPRDFSQKVNRKMYRGALSSVLSELIRQDRLVVVDKFQLETHRTKEMLNCLQTHRAFNALLVTDEDDLNFYLGSRNIPDVFACHVSEVNPYYLVRFEKIMMTQEAVKKLEEQLQ